MKNKMVILYIEGTSNDTNGDLRQGFSKLLSQKLQHKKMPRIKMTDGKSQSIKAFKHPLINHDPLLVIDLDYPEEQRLNFLKEQELEGHKEKIFFMIQEMEAWFLSQPSILDEFYSYAMSKKIRRKESEIENPGDFLATLAKSTSKGEYHKVRHGVPLLERLNLDLLMNAFPDIKRLVKTLDSF